MTDHDPCVCPVCREAGMRNNPDKVIAELKRQNDVMRNALRRLADIPCGGFGQYATRIWCNQSGCPTCMATVALGEAK